MAIYVLKRLAVALPIILIVTAISFLLLRLVPGNPAASILGTNATQDQIDALNARLGLNEPLPVQFLVWLSGAVRGDFGLSWTTAAPVTDVLANSIPVTLSLAVLATAFAVLAGIGLGGLAAIRGGWIDRIVYLTCSFFNAIPSFWIASVLILIFSIGLGWFPSGGYTDWADPVGWILGLVLPVLALSLGSIARIAFLTRASILDVVSREYVRNLRAVGIPRRRIVGIHVLRNAGIPVVSATGTTFLFLLGGVVVVEAIFGLTGMGSLILRSVQTYDSSVVLATIVYFTITVVVVNLITDLLVAWMDPRGRVK